MHKDKKNMLKEKNFFPSKNLRLRLWLISAFTLSYRPMGKSFKENLKKLFPKGRTTPLR